ncbi:MAG TPA: hypothetical protein VFZ65_10435 [Planctomycetota bacterium]|nr:hypothetical protein [Planctomycetota bacterium]
MSSREPAGSRPPSSNRPGSARSGGSRAGARGAAAAREGKVDVNCPQCGVTYRIAEEKLDSKIECTECHRVFFAKAIVGKRAKPPDHTKTYILFGVAGVVLVGLFIMMSGNTAPPAKKPVTYAPTKTTFSLGTHPRALEITKWAQAMSASNLFVIKSYSDVSAIASTLEIPADSDDNALLAAISTHESTKYLRELDPASASLATEEDMTAASGKGIVFVTPKPGDDVYRKNTRGEIEVTFTMAGDQVKVTGWKVKLKPIRDKPDPSKMSFIPNKDIAKPTEAEISDSAGTRKVAESQPAAVPHWEKATPEQRQKADQVVADLLRSADPEAPGGIGNKARLSVRTVDDRKATIPRVLNAMYELYGDVNGNNLKLIQLDAALREWTGFANNYARADSGDATKDKAARESCVRQWFAFWYRYSSGKLDEFIDTRDNLEEPLDDGKTPKKPGK